MYPRFGLVLMVNHACNLRCTYCYTGRKFTRPMPEETGRRCIDRAVNSLTRGGPLELSFFGGEPMLEARLVQNLSDYAREVTARAGAGLSLSLTTNGTIADGTAWSVMTDQATDLAVSHDGLPEVHDKHRVSAEGGGSSERVLATLKRLLEAGKDFRVVMVVRPDTLEFLPDGIAHLQETGVRHIEATLDLWAKWTREDVERLQRAVSRCAQLWSNRLPHFGINWFDEKAAGLARVPMPETARCRFGDGEIAVAPSGRLYPCERLIGEDSDDNPMRIPGHALDGDHFPCRNGPPERNDEACAACGIRSNCSTTCRCSNYIRTGDIRKPDALLCFLNKLCFHEVVDVCRPAVSPET